MDSFAEEEETVDLGKDAVTLHVTRENISSSSLPDIPQSASRVGSPVKQSNHNSQENVQNKTSGSSTPEKLPSLEDTKSGPKLSCGSGQVEATPELSLQGQLDRSNVSLTAATPAAAGEDREPTKTKANGKRKSPKKKEGQVQDAQAQVKDKVKGRGKKRETSPASNNNQAANNARKASACYGSKKASRGSRAGSCASSNGSHGPPITLTPITAHDVISGARKMSRFVPSKQPGERLAANGAASKNLPQIHSDSLCAEKYEAAKQTEKDPQKVSGEVQVRAKAMGLTEQQVRAFLEVFELFDSNGGGTIDAEELDMTLRSVGICLTQDEIKEVLHTIDEDGNGEIDFNEFLQLMTNTEKFLESVAIGTPRDHNRENLLFEALTEFMKKSALNSMDEIVGYFHTKYKRVQVPHVVNHYAAGARLIGLSERQLKQHLEHLKASHASNDQGIKSPYAQPLHIVMSATNVKSAMNMDMPINTEPHRGRIKLRIKMPIKMPREVQGPGGEDHKFIKVIKKAPAMTSPMRQFRWGTGWTSQRTDHIEVVLPPKQVKKLTPFDQLTAEDLPNIRTNVTKANLEYRLGRRHSQIDRNLRHWKTLQASLISPEILRNHFRMVFSHYSAIKPSMLPLAVH